MFDLAKIFLNGWVKEVLETILTILYLIIHLKFVRLLVRKPLEMGWAFLFFLHYIFIKKNHIVLYKTEKTVVLSALKENAVGIMT